MAGTGTVAAAGEAAGHGAEHAAHVAMSLADQLPVLQILVPFVAAPLIVLLGSRRLAWPIAYGAATAAFVISVFLLMRVIGGEVISYHIGGWAPPLGIEYRIDAANAFVLFLVTAIATVVLPYAKKNVAAEIDTAERLEEAASGKDAAGTTMLLAELQGEIERLSQSLTEYISSQSD